MKALLQRPPSLFEAGRNCCALAQADRVAFLIDGDAYFRAFTQAAERAEHSIVIIAWDFNSTASLHLDGAGKRGTPPDSMGDYLNWLARRRRGLQIFVLDWDYPMLYATDRDFPRQYGLGWEPHHRVHVHYDNTHTVTGCHHQKIVVIDGSLAFVGGLDLTARRWDTPGHLGDDPRRTHDGVSYPPFHDLMVMVDGEAARALANIARDRWQAATEQLLAPTVTDNDPWPPGIRPELTHIPVAISRTMPATADREEVREVEQLYLDMITAARRTIYIENQYFTAYRIGEALAARLAEPDGPEVIVVSRLLSHGWLEEYTMHVLRTRLIRRLQEADRNHRLHLYFPHVEGLKEGTCIDVHSKLMIVDDEVLRIGSANLCNRSMGMDSECDIALEARGDVEISAFIDDFRCGLLGEHLGLPPARVKKEVAARGSLFAAIEVLRGPGRSLRPLDQVPEWPAAVLELARVADPERPVSLDNLMEQLAPAPEPPEQKGSLGTKLAMFVLVIFALAALWRFTPLADLLDADRIIAFAHDFGRLPWAPLAIILAYTPASFVMFPRPLITLTAIVAFGTFPGVAYALVGIMLAAFISYLIGRRLPRSLVRRLAGPKLKNVIRILRRRGLVAMAAVRLVPVMPFPVVGLVAAAINIRLRDFMGGSLIGLVPGTVATTVFGDQLEGALRDPSRISYGLIAVVVAVLALISFLVRRWFKAQLREKGQTSAKDGGKGWERK